MCCIILQNSRCFLFLSFVRNGICHVRYLSVQFSFQLISLPYLFHVIREPVFHFRKCLAVIFIVSGSVRSPAVVSALTPFSLTQTVYPPLHQNESQLSERLAPTSQERPCELDIVQKMWRECGNGKQKGWAADCRMGKQENIKGSFSGVRGWPWGCVSQRD